MQWLRLHVNALKVTTSAIVCKEPSEARSPSFQQGGPPCIGLRIHWRWAPEPAEDKLSIHSVSISM